jgi:hypothetical protein
MVDVWHGILGQFIALVTFFAFPAFQNVWLRYVSSKDGAMNLSFSPRYGFRLATANQFGRRVFSGLRWRGIIRRIRPSPNDRGRGLFDDVELLKRDDFFLFPGADQILVAFKLRRIANEVMLVPTSVVGVDRDQQPVGHDAVLVCDFTANIEMLFNFDYKIAKRAVVDLDALVAECTADENGHLAPRDWRRLNLPSIFTVYNAE